MTTEERVRRLEAVVTRLAENQAEAWDAIGAVAKSHATTWDAVSTLAKSHATTAKEIQNLTVRLGNLAQLVERFIRAQKNGRNGG